VAIVFQPLTRVAPGIGVALSKHGIDSIDLNQETDFEKHLPNDTTLVALGAVFESFALDLLAWAKQRQIPVIAIQEVAQLALNQFDINNYDAPFDRLFVASPDEEKRFLDLGYPSEMLTVSGLLANDRLGAGQPNAKSEMLANLGLAGSNEPIVYTTSPVRGRLSLHNKDDLDFRDAVLNQIAAASRRTGRRAVIKLHPNEDAKASQDRIQRIIPDAIVVGRELHTDELFPATGVLVNRGNSQTCLEAVLRGIPTVVSACGLNTLFHEDGGAYIVDELSKVAETIERAVNEGPVDASRVKSKHFHLPAEGVAEFIAKELLQLVSDPQPATDSTWNWLIKSLLFMGRHDRALALCNTLQSRSSWQALVRDALHAHSEQCIEDSIACWLKCAQLDPQWYFPHYELAHGFQAIRQFDVAIEHAHKAIETHPPFHTLWHEIPMRVVIMASLRQMGDISTAKSELERLQQRGLVDILPELLIEKAAQLSLANGLHEAAQCLNKVRHQLVNYPVNETTDAQLMERAAFQFLQLGQQWENDKDLHAAEKCYNLATETYPTDHRSRYGLARVALKQGRLHTAVSRLRRLIEIPDGPKQVIAKILSPTAVAQLSDYWPTTPKSILRPLKLSAYAFAWAVQKMVKSGFHDFFEASTTLLMIWMFTGRHFYRRLSVAVTTERALPPKQTKP
jgi:tetratricopeptide (TPR) repeat protein